MDKIFLLQHTSRDKNGDSAIILASSDINSIYRYVYHNVIEKKAGVTFDDVKDVLSTGKSFKFWPEDSKHGESYKIIETNLYGEDWEPFGGDDLYDYVNADSDMMFNEDKVQARIDKWNKKNIDYNYKGTPISKIIKDIIKEAKKSGYYPNRKFHIVFSNNKFIWNPNAKYPDMPSVIIYSEDTQGGNNK